jgi:DNA-binding PadR family transcriptional regulator
MGRPQQPGADSSGTLDLLILSRLARGPMHGFGIAEYLHGSPTLCMWKRAHCIRPCIASNHKGRLSRPGGVSENNRRARFYKLTPSGRTQVSLKISNWRRMVEAVNRVIDPWCSDVSSGLD